VTPFLAGLFGAVIGIAAYDLLQVFLETLRTRHRRRK
jgi:hypothetical protein